MSANDTNQTQVDNRPYDVTIVGGGAAGLSAALVLGRARRRVAVVDAGHPRNAPAAHMHGFLGSDGLPPAELLARGRAEVAGYGVEQLTGIVSAIAPCAGSYAPGVSRRRFEVALADGSTLETRAVLVTTGLRDSIPDIPGVHERWGRDLLHCPYCHGYEVRDRPVGVLAGGPATTAESLAHAHIIRQWSDDVVFFVNGATLTAAQREQLVARAIGVVDEPVVSLAVDADHLTGVVVEGGRVVPRDAVFVRPQLVANDSLLVDLGCIVRDTGWVQVDATGATSVPGIWAAGNATNPRAQVITAAGEGSSAAIAINNSLVEEDLPIAVTSFRLGLPV
ncbi:thioredoxin reductase [Nocardioides sp. Root122]|uniref:NAD(P)/FAD-dependent oxidoreductase n=1 Tax=Nocardioides TaxID=1839 RepID=UPI0007036032|nr:MULTISPECIES: NAD(P)/FAD-dependent oxidoreductase [Nocardioides]KQV65823.1 thioredoxin reductase [Nocardioides sp. Root122]MCK9823256.1 NAD(P)/FAD-dependent oxidoreductase [Nocardioides cavernae]